MTSTESSFYKIPSVIQLLIAEFAVTFFLAGYYANFKLYQLGYTPYWAGPSIPNKGFEKFLDVFLLFILLLVFVWLLSTLLRPKIGQENWSPSFAIRYIPLRVFFSRLAIRYGFPSTHPSYLLIDFMMLGLAYFVDTMTPTQVGSYWAFEQHRVKALWIIASIMPILRIFCWYILGKKLKTEKAARPILMVAILFYGIGGLITSMIFLENRKEQKRLATLPIINAQNFLGGFSQHPEWIDPSPPANSLRRNQEYQTQFVSLEAKIRGTQKNERLKFCRPLGPQQDTFAYATLTIDWGETGEVIVLLEGENVNQRFTQNQGRPIEFIGRLRELPSPHLVPHWKEICGLQDLPPLLTGNRWLLESE